MHATSRLDGRVRIWFSRIVLLLAGLQLDGSILLHFRYSGPNPILFCPFCSESWTTIEFPFHHIVSLTSYPQIPRLVAKMNSVAQLLLALFASVNAFSPLFGVNKNQLQTRRFVVGNDKFDMEELRERIIKESNPYQNLFKTKEWEKRPKPDKVSIIFFQPDTPEEGIHTVEFPKGSSSNIILAFESMKDCGGFAALLLSQGFFDPTVSRDLQFFTLSQCLYDLFH